MSRRIMAGIFLAILAAGCGEAPLHGTRSAAKTLEPLYRFLDSRADWEARAETVRRGVREGTGLVTLPPRTPLGPLAHSFRERDGYTIENVAFQSLPGVFVPGNLYRPRGKEGPFPVLLQLHGHFDSGDYWPRSYPDNQASAGHLAQMGAIVLAIDFVGYGDFTQLPHDLSFVMALEVWNDLSAVDYLCSLDDADCTRVGVFGPSGGGFHSVLLSVFDPRVRAVAPVVMISASYDGEDPDEAGMDIRSVSGTNNTEIAALFAPGPQLFVSDGNDWTADFPKADLPYLQKVYSLFGCDAPESVFLPNDEHGFGKRKRAAVYDFFAQTFGLAPLPLDESESNPEGIAPEPQSIQRVFDDQHPRPASAIKDAEQVYRLLYEL